MVMIVRQCACDEKDSPSMCFLFGMLHLLTCTLRFGRDPEDISGHACVSAPNTTAHSCSAVSAHSTGRTMCHFDFILCTHTHG